MIEQDSASKQAAATLGGEKPVDDAEVVRTLGDAFKLYPTNEKIADSLDTAVRVTGVKCVRHETPVVAVDDKGDDVPGIRFQKPPAVLLQQEKYDHRVICFLKAEGKTNREVAEITGLSPTTINYVIKQPWAEELIMQEIHKRGGNAVNHFLQDNALPAVKLLADVVLDEDAANKDRIAAANAILDRAGYGRSSDVNVRHNRDLNEYTDEELLSIISGACSTSSTGTQAS